MLDALTHEWNNDPVILRLRAEEVEDHDAGLLGKYAKAPAENL
jgi:hypothetical protein